MTNDWCPENDGAYRAELAAMHRAGELRKLRADLIDMDVLRRVEDAVQEQHAYMTLCCDFGDLHRNLGEALTALRAMMEKMK